MLGLSRPNQPTFQRPPANQNQPTFNSKIKRVPTAHVSKNQPNKQTNTNYLLPQEKPKRELLKTEILVTIWDPINHNHSSAPKHCKHKTQNFS